MAPRRPKQTMSPESQTMSPESRSKYQKVMDALETPVSSYTLLYEPHLIPKIRGKKKTGALKGKTEPRKFVPLKSTPESRNKPKKGASAKQFTTNVKTLTATGMFDGIAVRYLHKRKKIELGGIIQGSGYLCGCASCNYSKTVTAEEFEHHAGSETSHANNHIFFENGKSAHMVVKELQNTPKSMLFDVIQTVTGSPLNQEAFSTCKELYQQSGSSSLGQKDM